MHRPVASKSLILGVVALGLLLWSVSAVGAAEPVTLTVAEQDGHEVIKLENYRVQLTIDPARGGAVTSYSDKLAPAEIVLQKEFNGLCMDHFQEQIWPGEFLERPYEYEILKQTPEEVQVKVWCTSTGLWRSQLPNEKISNLLLEKTYTLRADSPALTCAVTLIVPEDQAKVFSYWIQNVLFAGGDYDVATDRTFRPSARGVRSNAMEENGHYGREEWMRDFSGGWIALVDTEKKTGLATLGDYNDLSINYACGGNVTNELMFNTTYLPAGQSRTYSVQLCPLVGLDNLLHMGPNMMVGYRIETDNQGSGQIDFLVERSVDSVQEVQFAVSVVSAADPSQGIEAGTLSFGALTDQPQSRSLTFSGGPLDPIVVRVAATGHLETGEEFQVTFEDFFPGAYKWADNIQTDMRTPVYSAERPPQTLTLAKPEELVHRPQYRPHYLFFQGLLDEKYQVAAAVHTTGYAQSAKVIHYRYSGSWLGSLTDFPYDYDELLSYSGIILGGVSKSGLKPIGLEMLHDYLLAGGGMVVLGSHAAYGRSQLQGTKLGDALPVEFSDELFDLESTRDPRITPGPDQADFLTYAPLQDNACCYYLHSATPKPDAQVLMMVDEKPFLVAGEYGPNQARIVCILGAPMGEPAPGQVPFWEDPGWYVVLRNVLWWVEGKDDHFAEQVTR